MKNQSTVLLAGAGRVLVLVLVVEGVVFELEDNTFARLMFAMFALFQATKPVDGSMDN